MSTVPTTAPSASPEEFAEIDTENLGGSVAEGSAPTAAAMQDAMEEQENAVSEAGSFVSATSSLSSL
jgi:hypothetical protein